MKRKRIKSLTPGQFVKCSFCKEKTADKQLVGCYDFIPGIYAGGRSVCEKCYRMFQEKEKEWNEKNHDMSLGEETAYRIYKAF